MVVNSANLAARVTMRLCLASALLLMAVLPLLRAAGMVSVADRAARLKRRREEEEEKYGDASCPTTPELLRSAAGKTPGRVFSTRNKDDVIKEMNQSPAYMHWQHRHFIIKCYERLRELE